MKKLIPLLSIFILLLTSCGSDYDMNGTYTSESEDMDFTVVICDDFCMIDVTSTNESGGTASVVLDGKLTKENDIAVITIEEESDIEGTQFEFVYNERAGTLTSTSDNSVLKKVKVTDAAPNGIYTASDSNNSFEISIDGKDCELMVKSRKNDGQTAAVKSWGKLKADGDVVSIEFKDSSLGDDIFRFIYSRKSDLLMNTSDGKIFEKQKED